MTDPLREALIRALAQIEQFQNPNTEPGGWWDQRIEPLYRAALAGVGVPQEDQERLAAKVMPGTSGFDFAATPAPEGPMREFTDDFGDTFVVPAPAPGIDENTLSRIRSHAFGPCLVCGAQADDPEAFEECGGPAYAAAAGEERDPRVLED